MTHTRANQTFALSVVVFAAVFGFILTGCAGSQTRTERAQRAAVFTGYGLDAYEGLAETVILPAYSTKADECRAADPAEEAYAACMERPNSILTGLAGGYHAMRAADDAANGIGGADPLACVASSVISLRNTLSLIEGLGTVEIPDKVTTFLDFATAALSSYAPEVGATCEP